MFAKYESSSEKTSCHSGNYVVNDEMSLKTTDCEIVNGSNICYHGLFKTELSDRFPLDTKYSYTLSHCKLL